jgi:zinc protease
MQRPRPTIFALATLTMVVVVVLGFGRTLSAQLPPPAIDAPSTKGMVRKNKVPVSSEILKIKLPKAAESDLKNGLHLIVLEDHRLPQISFQLFIPGAGGYYDPADRPGLATFTAALMREGTGTRTSNEISRQLEVMAASLAVGAGASSTEATLTGSCLSDQFDLLLDLAADVLLHPSFPDAELARYKQRTRSGFAQQRSNPGFLAGEMFSRAIYGTHPAGRVSPSAGALDKTTREALVEFHKTRYVPDRAALAIAGDISMAESRALVEAKLADWAKAGVAGLGVSDPKPTSGAGIYFIARPNSVQTNLIVGTQAIERTSPDFDVLSVMNKVVGGGPTGRLFLHLREEKGYTYGASSTLVAPVYRGAWQAATNVRTEVTEPALNDLLAEIRRLRDEPIPEQELNDAVRSMVAEYALELESPTQLLNLNVISWRFKLPSDYWDRRAERLIAVTSAQVQAAARKYLAPDRLQIVAVGDPARVADSLKKLGTIETYDIEGKRVESF